MKKIQRIGLILCVALFFISSRCYAAYNYQNAITSFVADRSNYEDITGGAVTDRIQVQELGFLKEIASNWCHEKGVSIVADNSGKGHFFLNNEEITVNYIMEDIWNNVDAEARSKLQVIVQNTGILNEQINAQQFRDNVIGTLAEEQGVKIDGSDSSDPFVDWEEEVNSASGMVDVLAGILLYPLKFLILVIAEGLNVLATGVMALGGKVDGMVSVSDIIFTTGTSNTGLELAAINFFDITNASGHVQGLRAAVAGWFYLLRNLSIVISLCILIYVGIRMAISALAEDKARYKNMILNWVVQMVLVFFMQYIIFFTIGVNNVLVDAMNPETIAAASTGEHASGYMAELFNLALSPTVTKGFGAAILYCVLLGMTVSFAIMYIKRMITIAFLIVISPVVTVTYAVDKLGDSKSQAMNTWLKEFVYNVLIQPFHCILYLVFVSTAISMMTTAEIGNFGAPVLAIITMMFLFKAEDILRKIFAFDKNTKTLGTGLATAAAVGAGLGTIKKMFRKEEKTSRSKSTETMPDVKSVYQSQIGGAKDKQGQEGEANPAVGASSVRAANQVGADSRSNTRAEEGKTGGSALGMAGKFVAGQAKLALPVVTAFLGAGQGSASAIVAAGGAGMAVEKGIERAASKIGTPSTWQMSKQAKANEAAFGKIYKEQERKWKAEGGRWENLSDEEIVNDVRNLLAEKDLNQLLDKNQEPDVDRRVFGSVLQAQNDAYKTLGYHNPEGSVAELVRRIQRENKR